VLFKTDPLNLECVSQREHIASRQETGLLIPSEAVFGTRNIALVAENQPLVIGHAGENGMRRPLRRLGPRRRALCAAFPNRGGGPRC